MAPATAPTVSLRVDGLDVEVRAEGTLLDALREELGVRTVKDGCSPQGQCGCCTVLIDGAPRVACVTPVRRVAGREVTTLDGLDPELLDRLLRSFESVGASQCGFCTPGILVRLAGLRRSGAHPDEGRIRAALGAHLCRCTGFQTIVEAAQAAFDPDAAIPAPRDRDAAAARASLESGTTQHVGDEVARGLGGFSADLAAEGVTVALAVDGGGYVTAPRLSQARAHSGKVQGRNSTVALTCPLDIPRIDDAVVTLATTFVEPAYVEPDASLCEPGGVPSSPFANAGAFGAKRHSPVTDDAAAMAAERGEPVLAVWSREEVVRRGAKRPPIALALRADMTGVLRVAVTPGSESMEPVLEVVRTMAPGLEIELVDVQGPRLGVTHRGAVVAEVLAARCVVATIEGGPFVVRAPNGASASVTIDETGSVAVSVDAGAPLCPITLRSYVIGAVHQALGMVRSEGIAVDEEGAVHDLTIRSFGIVSASQMPPVSVDIVPSHEEPVASGVAVLAATMAAAWVAEGQPERWPTRREVRS